MNATLEVDSSTFDQAIGQLMKITGRSQKDVIENEMQRILQTANDDTKGANAKLIDQRYTWKGDLFAPKDSKLIAFVTVDGKKVRVRSVHRKGMWVELKSGKRRWSPNKINPLFKKVKAKLDSEKARAKGNRGQSKATWIYIGNLLGLSMKPKVFVAKALGNMPQSLKNKLLGKNNGQADFTIEIENGGRTVLTRGADGRKAFRNAWKGREDFYQVNLATGVFETVGKTLAKYPGLKVSKG
jgi:hypothetical protein